MPENYLSDPTDGWMAPYESLDASELAAVWLSGDPDAEQYCLEPAHVRGVPFWTDWLVMVIELAEGDDQVGRVGAGPVEAALGRNIYLAKEVESRVSPAKLRAVLESVWYSDATPEVKNWALQILDAGGSTPNRRYPHGLTD